MKNIIFKKYSDKEVMCLVCKTYVSNHSKCLKTHVYGRKHQLLICNSIRVRDDEIYCRLCDIVIDDTEIIDLYVLENHIEQYYHVTALEEVEDLIDEFIMLPDESESYNVQCTICECYIPFKHDDISNHVNGHQHRVKRSMAVKPLNGIISVKDDDEQLWCKVCKEFFPNYVDDILDHIADDKHTEILDEIEDLIEDEDISIVDFLNHKNQDKAYCQRCYVFVPFSHGNLEQHIEGYKHCR